MKRGVQLAAVLGLLALLIVFFGVLLPFGAFRGAEERETLGTRIVGMHGPEDLTIDRERGYLYVSSDNRRARLEGKAAQGAIYRVALRADSLIPVNITPTLSFEFNPHGISLYKAELGITRLFVINHRSSGHFVEIFDVKPNGLVHLESITASGMYSPNDLVAVGLRSFYVTNDHGPEEGFARLKGDLLRQGKASVGYFDGQNFRIVAKNLNYANGIQVSSDGSWIFVAETTGKTIRAYARSFVSGQLEEKFAYNLNTGLDNIEWTGDGRMLVAAHPNMLAFMRHASNPKKTSPSQVLSLRFDPQQGFFDIQELLKVSGKTFSGSSTAAYYEGRYFVGNVFEPEVWVISAEEL